MAPEKKDERIDLNNLKQRELLILVANNVERLEERSEKVETCVQDLLIKVNTLETKSKIGGSVWGSIAGLVTAVITIIIEKFINS